MLRGERVVQPELLDNADPAGAAHSLRDLRWINRVGGGYTLATELVARAARGMPSFSLLDAGAGSADVSAAIAAKHPRSQVTVADLKPHHVAGCARAVAADVLALPFRNKSFDIAFCSLFLHQFDDEAAVRVLCAFRRVARHAVCVCDLYRHAIPYRAIGATRWLFRWHEITLHDAPVSVAAGFRPDELAALAARAGLRSIEVRRHMPWFRVTLLAKP
jgi:SAM-dependent methyltransferase